MRLILNTIQSFIYTFFGWIQPIIYSAVNQYGGIYVYDFKHYPNYVTYIYEIPPQDEEQPVYDVQPDVSIFRSRTGSILGYIGDDGYINYTDWVGHVTLEGTIIIWGVDDDPYGIPCVVIPFNTQLQGVMVDGLETDLAVVPQPVSAQKFTSTDVRWQHTDVPGHWFISRPRVDIDVKWNVNDHYPYVDTSYWGINASRYDDKWFSPAFKTSGVDQDIIILRPPQIRADEFEACVNKCALYISWIKHKYDVEPTTLWKFRKTAVMSTTNE